MDGDTGGTLPEDLRAWVDDRAEAQGVDPETVLTRAVSTYRLAVTDLGASLDDIDAVSEKLDTVEGRVDGLEETVSEKIDDVRMRVVQVKRETDEKAAHAHDHPTLREDIDDVTANIETVREQLSAVESRVEGGFDNYEEILTYLDETTTDLDERLDVVAASLADVRSRVTDIEAAHRERKQLSTLLRTANDAGERKATCDNCEETVHLDLLTEPRCPACQSAFEALSPSKGFFGSATLRTGQPLALEAASSPNDDVTTLADADGATNLDSKGETGKDVETDSADAVTSAGDSGADDSDELTHETTPNTNTND
ncbi:hypothetical protein [Haloferax sp. DFSO52]|uniref:hypothetical protein n=1 Tax=Haloferax sp. DFSO52 TaxID=3388505 RepID=UPI003A89168F